MAENLTRRVAETRSFLGKLWTLSGPYWWCDDISELRLWWLSVRVPERWLARGLLAVILALVFFVVYLNKLFNDWYGRFYDALQNKNEAAFWDEVQVFTILAFIYIVALVYRMWLRQLLEIRWRRWLTRVYSGAWLTDRTYYRLELIGNRTDNPEQRIEQDIGQFAKQTLAYTLDSISETVTLVTFTIILWRLSADFVLPLFGGIQVPGFMMWAALLYAVIGSWATYMVGRPLVRTSFNLERYNADFRYRMTRIRENAESIALYDGEPDEQRRLDEAFGSIYDTFWAFMSQYKRLIWLTAFYNQAAVIFPLLIAGPSYFAGVITLGVVTQVINAFGTVQSSLSWFVNTYAELAVWKATVDRMTSFSEAMTAAKERSRTERAFEIADGAPSELTLDDVAVALPDGRTLLEDVDVRIEQGSRVILQGPSGSGKTTLFRVLAGLWPFGHGRLRVPRGAKVLFLPQRPYIPIGSLRAALCYPDQPEEHTEAEIAEALIACDLGHLRDRLGEAQTWSMILSPGEQQRLAIARALLVRPDWLFLDEATSALDEPTEARLYELLRDRLAGATMVSIAHKPGVARFHDRILRIDPATRRVIEALPSEA